MTHAFIGLDGEMTGGDSQPPGQRPHFQVHQLVQIGLAYIEPNGNPFWFSSVIGHEQINESEPEAMAVHGITKETILAAARPREVDASAARWIDELMLRRAIPVGYSVGSFDMPYVREYLPELGRRLSMRAVDLNAVVFTIEGITGRSYNAIKSAGKNYAEKQIAKTSYSEKRAHDAGYDALLAIHSWEFFKSMLVIREIHDHF